MKTTIIKLLVASLLTVSFVCLPAIHAAPEKQEAAKETSKDSKRTGMPFNGKITAVDKNAKTISLNGKEKPRVFYATAKTKFTKGGNPARFEDAKVGEETGGYAEKTADGKLELRSLRIGPKPEVADKTK